MAISYWMDPKTGKLISSANTGNALPGAPNNTVSGAPAQAPPSADPFAAITANPVADPYTAMFNTPEAPSPITATPAPEAPAADPWADIANSYGLGTPPAQGLPTTMPNVNIGAAPQAQANLLDMSQIPQPSAQQMQISPEIAAMKSGQGYSPDILAKMKANASQGAASAGLQQLSQTKRVLGQSGVRGGAAAAVQGDIARQTGQNQMTANNNIDISNAQVGNENAKFGISQETGIGQNNMAAANAMALENANKLFSGMKSNQDATNTTNQMNTGLGFQRQENQANMDYNNEKSQWDELNKRFGQSQNILGSWGAAA